MIKKILLSCLSFAVLLAVILSVTKQAQQDTAKFPAKSESTAASFNKKELSLDDPKSLWIIVNKQRPLDPPDFAPDDLTVPDVSLRNSRASDEMKLRKPAATALKQMLDAASKEYTDLLLASGYRSYGLQKGVYNRYVKTEGQASADSQSARPGHSEHQTGLAVDVGAKNRVCELEECFGITPEGKWVAANAYKYGFVIRYQKNTQNVVGYIYEPWHLRYVGTKLSNEIHKQDSLPLETFFGMPPAPDYK